MTNQLNLQQRHAVVTGAASGLGFAIANRLLASGARLTLWDRDPKGLEQAAHSLQSNAAGSVVNTFTVDVASHASVAEAARHTQAIAPVDILVNSAGISGVNAKLWEYPIDAWEQIIDINLNGTFLCCRELVPGMRERNYGRIVNIASVAGKEGNPNASAYSASKAAVIGLTKSLAADYVKAGLRANALCPGTVDTPSLRGRVAAQGDTEAAMKAFVARQPIGRLGTAEEVAALAVHLAADESGYTSGTTHVIDGGWST